MKQYTLSIAGLIFFSTTNALALQPMTQHEIEKYFSYKTQSAIEIDRVNSKTISGIFRLYMGKLGKLYGETENPKIQQPKIDTGFYTIQSNGEINFRWQHWSKHKMLCGRIYNFKNAYIITDCKNAFHTVYMKADTRSGNQISKS